VDPVPVLSIAGARYTAPTWLSPDACRLYLYSAAQDGTPSLYVAERSPS
jgi:hypothetical protein